MVRFYILFLMAFCNVLIPLNASEIKGTVLDEYDTPMQYAKVVLYQDSNFICGTVTDSKGLFTFTDFQKANRIDISMTGYQTYSSIPQNNMGIITLSPDFKVLGEVTVLSQKPTIKLSNEGMVTTVTGSILANVGTADDVICRLPLVNGKNGAYTVFGAGTPTVYINGRQVRDVSELQQLSSNNINSVEVITNPGSKYPSNIRAVIKIKTKKPIGDGIGIGLWSRNGISHYPSTSNILNAKYRKGGIDLFGTVYYSWGKGRNRQHFEQTTFTDAIYTQDMYGLNTYTTQRISGKVGVNWQLNDKHSFGFFWQTNQTDNHSYNNMISDIRMDNVPFEHWESSGSSEATTRPSNSANLYYNGSIGKLLIDFNADYMDNKVTSDRSEYETSISDGNRNVISHNRTDARLFAEKTILTYPIWKGDLEVGQEYTNTSTHFKYYYTGATIPSSDNSIHESNITIFSELRQTFGIFQIGTGIRYEHVDNKYTSYDSEQDIKTFKYDDIFPSIFLSTQIHDVQLGLNFTAKNNVQVIANLTELYSMSIV